MIVFVAVDNRNGMMFNHRRQSQDKALRERVVELSKGKKLWMNQYSAKQFLQDEPLPTLQVDNMPLDRAQPEDFCFAEDLRLAPYERKIEKSDVLEYKEWLIGHYSIRSVNSMLAALDQFLIFLGAGQMRVKRIKVQEGSLQMRKQELGKAEFRRLVSVARDNGQSQLAMLMETICATGIRVSELKFFNVNSIKTGIVEVKNKGKQRVVLLPEKLRKRLLLYTAKNKIRSGPVFCTRSGKTKDRSNIWKEMKRLAEKAGIDAGKVFPHNLRHLFARTFYRATKNLIHLADILGHSSVEVTRIYAREGIWEWKRSLDRMDLLEE